MLEFDVVAVFGEHFGLRQDHADETVIETVLDTDEGRRDLHERRLVRFQRAGDDFLQALGFLLHVGAQLSQTQHAEGIADLAQHIHLRRELFGLPRSAADEDIEDVLDLGQILADGCGDRLHELHARCGQVLALLLDALVDGQQLGQSERGADGHDSRPRRFGTPDVIEKVIEQLDRGRLGVAGFALLIQPPDLAVAEAEQALDRHAAFQSVLAQRLDHGADDPPQLEDRLARRDLLELVGNGRQNVQVLLDPLPSDPADQADLETGAQAPGPLLHRQRRLTGRHGNRLRLLV